MRKYEKGLHQVGNGTYAYLQPHGQWGLSNAGVVEHGGKSVLIDTLFDLRLTEEMLRTIKAKLGTSRFEALVNTHDNGDHCFGNQLVDTDEIIASRACAEYMDPARPAQLQQMIQKAQSLGDVGKYYLDCFGRYDFSGIQLKMPTKTFETHYEIKLNDLSLNLVLLGPAHTDGDIIIHHPSENIVFTGDIIFNDATPIMWSGPVKNWIAACDYILNLDVTVVVPGHGPISDKNCVKKMKKYLQYISTEAKKRFDSGLDVFDAAMDIALHDYESWGDNERIVANVHSLYREFEGVTSAPRKPDIFALMAKLKKSK